MTLEEIKEIIEKRKDLAVYEERSVSNDYYEIVFYTKDSEEWNRILENILGAAAKPAGKEPSEKDVELTKEYGGVRDNQALYKKQFGDVIVVAMFWPWQDEVRTTLKIGFVK